MDIDPKPAVVGWFKYYAIFMVFVYLFVFLMGFLFMANPEMIVDPNASWYDDAPSDKAEAMVMGFLYSGLGFVLMIAHALVLFLGRKKWVWTYSIVLICLGMTSCCCLPINIPLLIYWNKKECKDWFRD